MFKLKLQRRSRVMASMIASAAFIAMAMYGWDLPARDVALFAGICLLLLAVLMGAALGLGWILARLRRNDRDNVL